MLESKLAFPCSLTPVQSLVTTDAAAADITQTHQLLHGEESEVFGDQAYWCAAHRQAAQARGEHAFLVVKHLWVLYQSALPGPGQEHRAIVHGLCAGQPVFAQATVAHTAGNLRLVNGKTPQRTANPDQILKKTSGFCLRV